MLNMLLNKSEAAYKQDRTIFLIIKRMKKIINHKNKLYNLTNSQAIQVTLLITKRLYNQSST